MRSTRRRVWAGLAVTAGLLGGMVGMQFAAGASASGTTAAAAATSNSGLSASAIFGCRASLARVSLVGDTLLEPSVANTATTPCDDDSSLSGAVQLAVGPLSLGSIGPAGEFTDETGALGSTTSPGVTAVSDIQAVNLNLAGYTLTIAGPIEAQAAIECVGTTLSDQGSASLDALTVSGPGLPSGGESLPLSGVVNDLLDLPAPLSDLLKITADEQIVGTNSLTERVLDIQLLLNNIQVVVGEATASVPNPAICADNVPNSTTVTNTTTTPGTTVTTPGTTTTITTPGTTVTTGGQTITTPATTQTVTTPGSTTTTPGSTTTVTLPPPSGSVPSGLQPCTVGSSLDPTLGECVIYGSGGQVIIVSKPFHGPEGGVVLTIPEAIAKYGSDPCLISKGQQDWVLVATTKGGKVQGTPLSDRILGLGAYERIAGLAGNDCIYGKGGNQTIYDGNGKNIVYAAGGHNRIGVGNGGDHVYGRSIKGAKGTDYITTGNGNDTIYGGTGSSRINAGLGRNYVWGGPTKNRVFTNSAVSFVHCGTSKDDTLFARAETAAYGIKHGCEKIHYLKGKLSS
jgi:RTX calcium-binding nonapeptide repeat (4 copies)